VRPGSALQAGSVNFTFYTPSKLFERLRAPRR
jgi:hypothetical protein